MSNLTPILPEAYPYKLSRKRGPHNFDTIQPEDFGPEHDYELESHISKWIITPVSEAALQWLYCHLPEDCPRYGASGFIIEARFVNQIVKHMTADKLMSPEEYEQAMEESHAAAHQGEGR